MNRLILCQSRGFYPEIARITARSASALVRRFDSSRGPFASQIMNSSHIGDLFQFKGAETSFGNEHFVADPRGNESENDGDLVNKNRPKRHRRRVSDVLKGKPEIQTFPITGSVGDAIDHLARQGIGCTIAVNPKNGHVEGLFTARDILRFVSMKKMEMKQKGGSQSKNLTSAIMKQKIHDLVTPPENFVMCSPDNATTQCRRLMFEHKIRHIPVIKDGAIIGIVNSGDLSDIYFSGEIGGKRAFLEALGVGLKGLPEGTVVKTSKGAGEILTRREMLSRDSNGIEGEHDTPTMAMKPVPLYGIVTAESTLCPTLSRLPRAAPTHCGNMEPEICVQMLIFARTHILP